MTGAIPSSTLKVAEPTKPPSCHDCCCEVEMPGIDSPSAESAKKPEVKTKLFAKIMDILERITLIALSVLSLIVAPVIFVSVFTLGVVVGLIRFWNERNITVRPSGTIGCSQGFLEILTGVRLPQPLSLLANVGIILDHLLCHRSFVYAALTGASVGMMIGKSLVGCAEKITTLPACCGLNNKIAGCSRELLALAV